MSYQVAEIEERENQRLIYQAQLDSADRKLAADITQKRCEMAEWVQGLAPWDTYLTCTFRWEAGMWSANKCFKRWVSRSLPNAPCFYALEHNPSRAGYHVHALMAAPDVRRTSLWQSWFKRYGRARIVPVSEIGGVSGYCSKYVTKENTWYDALNCRQMVMSGR